MEMLSYKKSPKGVCRVIIYAKDVEMLTGKKYRTACKLLQDLRKAMGKSKQHFVTITEFCSYTGIQEELIREFIQY